MFLIFKLPFRAYGGFSSQEAGVSLPFLSPVLRHLTLSGYPCLTLSTPQPGSSPAILTNDNGSHRTRTEFVAGSETTTACSAPISTRLVPQVLCLNAPSNQAHLPGKLNGCRPTAKFPRSSS